MGSIWAFAYTGLGSRRTTDLISMLTELSDIGLPLDLVRCFVSLPESVSSSEQMTQEALYEAFRRMFRCKEARGPRGIVFVWAVDNPYRHDASNKPPSCITYIEETAQTISARWSKSHLINLTNDHDDGAVEGDLNYLRPYADVNRNFIFYTRLIQEHGPLRIWWASSSTLSETSGKCLDARGWEAHLLDLYAKRFQCLPLKNRKR